MFLNRLERAQKTRENLYEQLKAVADSTLSAEDRAYRLEEVLKKEEDRIHEVEKELNRLREKQVGDLKHVVFFGKCLPWE